MSDRCSLPIRFVGSLHGRMCASTWMCSRVHACMCARTHEIVARVSAYDGYVHAHVGVSICVHGCGQVVHMRMILCPGSLRMMYVCHVRAVGAHACGQAVHVRMHMRVCIVSIHAMNAYSVCDVGVHGCGEAVHACMHM